MNGGFKTSGWIVSVWLGGGCILFRYYIIGMASLSAWSLFFHPSYHTNFKYDMIAGVELDGCNGNFYDSVPNQIERNPFFFFELKFLICRL